MKVAPKSYRIVSMATAAAKLPVAWHCSEQEWYDYCIAHWSAIKDENHDGVLGGFGSIDEEDARGSLSFAAECLKFGKLSGNLPISGFRALDCGAGVGRVTKSVLLNFAQEVELVEVSEGLLKQAHEQLSASYSSRIKLTQASLREFSPAANSYNVVWAQWVLGHLTDMDLVQLLARCTAALRGGGAVCVKDNTCKPSECDQGKGRYLIDEENAGVIRTHAHLRTLFKLAGLKIVKSRVQDNFPEDLHTVRMYWLTPYVGNPYGPATPTAQQEVARLEINDEPTEANDDDPDQEAHEDT